MVASRITKGFRMDKLKCLAESIGILMEPTGPSIDEEGSWNNVPNQLTLIRVAFVPLVVGLLAWKTRAGEIAAALSFGVAAITDYYDGHIARTRQLITVFGKLMDPLADKFLVVCSLVMLQELGRVHPLIVMILICRELAITGLRALASSEGLIISASAGGKWKTLSQMIAIPFLMVKEPLWGWLPLFEIGQAFLALSVALSLISAKDYVIGFFRALREKRIAKRAKKARIKEAKRLRKLEKKARADTGTPPEGT
jgi:CDP-diacylglycerol--glycerol-3-phosphate 3-phosphatidyltransferase